MRIFDKFPKNITCPVCGTNVNAQYILVPIRGTKEGHTVEAIPVHLVCILDNAEYSKDLGVIGLKADYKQEIQEVNDKENLT